MNGMEQLHPVVNIQLVDTEILQSVVFLCMHAQVYAPIILYAPVFIVLYQLYIAIDGYSALLYHTLTISPT